MNLEVFKIQTEEARSGLGRKILSLLDAGIHKEL